MNVIRARSHSGSVTCSRASSRRKRQFSTRQRRKLQDTHSCPWRRRQPHSRLCHHPCRKTVRCRGGSSDSRCRQSGQCRRIIFRKEFLWLTLALHPCLQAPQSHAVASAVSPIGAGFPSCLFELSKMSKECNQVSTRRPMPDPPISAARDEAGILCEQVDAVPQMKLVSMCTVSLVAMWR